MMDTMFVIGGIVAEQAIPLLIFINLPVIIFVLLLKFVNYTKIYRVKIQGLKSAFLLYNAMWFFLFFTLCVFFAFFH